MTGRYRTIVADPPWPIKAGRWKSSGFPRPNERPGAAPYPTMSIEEIAALPIGELADADAHLYVWTVSRFLEQTFALARGWGFRHAQTLVWAKTPMGLGPGGAFAQTSEFVLFCRRGSLAPLRRQDSTWWNWPRPRVHGACHSNKPDAFLDVVEQVSPGPYAELFARRSRLGWDYPIGDQSLGGVAA